MNAPDPGRSSPLDLAAAAPRRRIHIVGIGGAGMSAIASVLVGMGHTVSGSDLKHSPGLERLRALGVTVHLGHAAPHLGDAEIVTVSTAIPPSNPEAAAARERGLPVLRRAETLAAISATKSTISVAGTHGKTTTSSMLAVALIGARLNPSFIIGGDVNEIGTNAAWSSAGDSFVIEADESDGTFNELVTNIAVITNIEPDHLDHYGGFDNLRAAFGRFARGAQQRIICADDRESRELTAQLRREGLGVVTYGTAADADVRISVERAAGGSAIRFQRDGASWGDLVIPLPGLHNARNAAAALAAAAHAGAPFADAARALSRFGGVARRFEARGTAGGVSFIDDYAHLPTEVEAALEAAAALEPTRVMCVFQPHRYSRTRALGATFADAFARADQVVVTDVYAANEKPIPGVTGRLVVDAILDAHPWASVAYLPQRRDALAYLAERLRPGDLCLTLGAGDLTLLPDELIPILERR